MTDYELMKSFDYFVNNSRIPNDVSFYDSFNYNTNTTLKTDFMIVIFSTFNDNLIPAFFNNYEPYIFMFNYYILYELLYWCIYNDHPNYLKYVINNLYNTTNSEVYNVLENVAGGSTRPMFYIERSGTMSTLINYILVLKKYNYSRKLEYEVYE